jgi:hypothetical protein
MRRKSERLTVLSEAEPFALYGMPDFDDGQQLEYLSLTEAELALACTPGFIVSELIIYLNEHKIVRPGYTTLQELISETLSAERRRLGNLLAEVLDGEAKAALAQLLVRDDTLSELARTQTRHQEFRLVTNGAGTGEACQTGTVIQNCQDAAAQVGDLAAESALLRESGQFLHRL